MITVYILVSLAIILIAILIRKYTTDEGFGNYYAAEDQFNKDSRDKSHNNLNKTIYVNSGLEDSISKISGALNLRDTALRKVKKANDYSKFFQLDPIPGLENDGKQCSMVLEPRLLPKHDSTKSKGCGWWYVDDDNGRSTGSLGTSNEPYQKDALEKSSPGGIWLWDLELAQKKEDAKLCRRIKSCEVSDLLPGKCGFCIEQNKGIPVNSKGESVYSDDPNFMCDTIVTKPIKCPRPETIPGKPVAGLCDPNPITGQLTNECLITLAKGAGCTDSGAIINILLGDSAGYYGGKGSNRNDFLSALSTLQSAASLSSPKEFFGFGPCSRAEALGYYNTVVKTSVSGQTTKVLSAAKFLAVGGNYDACPEDYNTTGPYDITCLERVALEAGCQHDGADFPKEIKQKPNNAPPYCKKYGRPNGDASLRIYSQDECNSLNGNFHGNGECTKKEGGSYSWDCRELNKMSGGDISTKDKYDGMRWGDIAAYFSDLYNQMHSTDKDRMISATKKCLGIDVAPPEPDCGDNIGLYCYCYKWDYDSSVVDGRAPKSLFYGRFLKTSMIEFNNNGEYTPFRIGTDRIHLRIKTMLKSADSQLTNIWITTDDGVGIIANDKIILQKWNDQGPTQYETSNFKLTETEETKLQINWYNNAGGYVLVPRIKQADSFVRIPDTMLVLDQPTGFPFARWDFYEGKIDDRCNNLSSEVIGNIPIGVLDGKKCGFFQNQNYIQITNGISTTAYKSISMMVYIRSEDQRGWPRLWEFNNVPLYSNWCQDGNFGCMSPRQHMGVGFYINNNCAGPSSWSGANTTSLGKWHHIVWAIDENLGGYTMYLDGKIASRSEDPGISAILKNRTYKNMYIVNSTEMFTKDVGVAWFRMFDYTMTAADVKIDANNGWSTNKLFPKSTGTGW